MAESFNSILMWLYLVELISESTERHMIFNTSEANFKDVGMFSSTEWQLLVSKILSMSSPIAIVPSTDRRQLAMLLN